MSKCPYCYREHGIWLKDPILLPDGSKYKWSDSTELTLVEVINVADRIYKGFYQINQEAKEIQDVLKDLEEDNLPEIDRTIFSPLNTSGKFQIIGKYIKEMRDSVEKLLNIFGLTKLEYFNYDEEGNHIICPLGDREEWIDPITNATDLQKFQIKQIHLEDLRHNLVTGWIETFDNDGLTPSKPIYNNSKSMSVWGTTNYNWAYADSYYGLQPNFYGKHYWIPMGVYELATQGLSIVSSGVGGGATGNSVIKQEDSKLKIDMSVSEASESYSVLGHHIGMGLNIWWVTNPNYTLYTPTAINNLKFKIDGLVLSGGEIGIGLRVLVSYLDNGVPSSKSHNISFVSHIFPVDIYRSMLWGSGTYFVRYRQRFPPSLEFGTFDSLGDLNRAFILDTHGGHGIPSYKVVLANGDYNLLSLINSIPTFYTYSYGYYWWYKMNYQTSDPDGINYVTSIKVNEVRIEGAAVEKGEGWNPYAVPPVQTWVDNDSPMHFEIDTLRLYV